MKHILIPTLLAIFLFSCAKEESISEPNEIPIDQTDPIPQFSVSPKKFQSPSRFLKREISFLRNNPLLKSIRRFTYDNSNRCIMIELGTIDSSLVDPVFNLKQTITFNYSGPVSLVPSSISSVRSVFPDIIRTYYYEYNAQGRKIKDSVRLKNQADEPADIVVRYQYSGDQVFVTPVVTGFPMENHTLDTLSLLTHGNIEKLVSRMIKSTGDEVATYTFTYDDAISPYNKLNIANSLYFESPSLGIGYNVPLETHYMGVTTNNMTSWTFDNYTVSFRYAYDQYNYPVKKEMILPGDTDAYQVILFEY